MMRDAAVTVTAVSFVFAVLAAAVFVLFPRQLVGLYLDSSDPETPVLIGMATGLMFYAALFQLTDAMQVIGLGLLRGVQDTRVPMIIAAISYWLVGMPIAYGLAFVAGHGAGGLWLGLVAGLTVAAILLMRRFWRGLARGDWTRDGHAGLGCPNPRSCEARHAPGFRPVPLHPGKTYEVADAIYDREIVSELYSTSGDYDLMAKVYIPEDQDVGHYLSRTCSTFRASSRTLTTMTFKAF
jgi:hypothetical protein